MFQAHYTFHVRQNHEGVWSAVSPQFEGLKVTAATMDDAIAAIPKALKALADEAKHKDAALAALVEAARS